MSQLHENPHRQNTDEKMFAQADWISRQLFRKLTHHEGFSHLLVTESEKGETFSIYQLNSIGESIEFLRKELFHERASVIRYAIASHCSVVLEGGDSLHFVRIECEEQGSPPFSLARVIDGYPDNPPTLRDQMQSLDSQDQWSLFQQ